VAYTSNCGSLFAFARAIQHECQLAYENADHGNIRISLVSKPLQNGLKFTRVQIECGARCGWLVEAIDQEAVELEQRALYMQSKLKGYYKQSPNSLIDVLAAVFPEFMNENKIKI